MTTLLVPFASVLSFLIGVLFREITYRNKARELYERQRRIEKVEIIISGLRNRNEILMSKLAAAQELYRNSDKWKTMIREVVEEEQKE